LKKTPSNDKNSYSTTRKTPATNLNAKSTSSAPNENDNNSNLVQKIIPTSRFDLLNLISIQNEKTPSSKNKNSKINDKTPTSKNYK